MWPGVKCHSSKLLTVKNLALEAALDIASATEQSLKEMEGMRKSQPLQHIYRSTG